MTVEPAIPVTASPITTPESLCDHLRTAVQIEFSTIPVYLTALWSMDENSNKEVQSLIRSVVMEEMLHMCLAANVFHAVRDNATERTGITGDHASRAHDFHVLPIMTDAPHYPGPLVHSAGLELRLTSFGPEAIEMFCAIEHPAAHGAPAEPGEYHTIGQFYAAIDDGLHRLGPELFHHGTHPECQIAPDRAYYGGGGEPVAVDSMATAEAALREIVEQGEGHGGSPWEQFGSAGSRRELAHFFRFDEIRQGRQYRAGDEAEHPTGPFIPVDFDAVRPIAPDLNDRTHVDLPPGVGRLMDVADETYRRLLAQLHSSLNGHPDGLLVAVPTMYQLGHQARALTKIPLGDGWYAGPRFRA
jgi:hypothetical protein